MSSSLQKTDISWESCEIDVFRDKPLGSGAYGIVCKAKYDQLPCAAKLLHPTFLVPGNWAVDKFMQECSFLASLKHPHIVQFLGVHTDKSTGQAVLLMELMDESLTTFLKRYKSSNQLVPLHIQVDICHDIALAIHYLHTKCIIHRDLSSNNILLLGGSRAKITDFGMSKLTLNVSTSLSSLTQVPGCPVYMPPEAWISPPIYTEKLDIFSFGVLMLQIATCRQPAPSPSESIEPSESSPTGYIKVPMPELHRRKDDIECMDTDHVLRELAFSCLQDRSSLRPSGADVCQSLETAKSSQIYINNVPSSKSSLKFDIERKSSKSSSIYDRRDSAPDNEKMEQLKKESKEKNLKIEKLTEEVAKLSSEVLYLKSDIITKEQEMKRLQEKKTERKESTTAIRPRIPSDYENVCLTGLSPEVLSVISKDPSSSVPNFSVEYHDISRGEVSFQYLPEYESKEQTISIFLQFYQHIFNSSNVKVGFVSIPSLFPQALLPDVLKLCSIKRRESSFRHIQLVNTVKVISNTLEAHEENIQRLADLLNLRVKIDEGRTLTIKMGNIIDEDVSVIVSSGNPPLNHRFGIAAAINAASLFEIQKHTAAYVHKHGILNEGNIACTKAGGNLKCDWVIHAVGSSGVYVDDEKIVDNSFKAEMVKKMRQLIHKILDKADDLQAKSIAIPAIGTGSRQLAVSLAITGILEGIVQHKFASSSKLSDIRITIMREDMFTKFAHSIISYQLLQTHHVTPNNKSYHHSHHQLHPYHHTSPTTSSVSSSHISSVTNTCKQQ